MVRSLAVIYPLGRRMLSRSSNEVMMNNKDTALYTLDYLENTYTVNGLMPSRRRSNKGVVYIQSTFRLDNYENADTMMTYICQGIRNRAAMKSAVVIL